jgi:hypothetical protein
MLKDICKCNKCQRTLAGKQRNTTYTTVKNKQAGQPQQKKRYGYKVYVCLRKRKEYKTCGLKSINVDQLDHVVWYNVLHTFVHIKSI